MIRQPGGETMGFNFFAKKGCGMKEDSLDKEKRMDGISDSSENSESSLENSSSSSSSSSSSNSSQS
jgi:hypothetical protein